MEEQASGRPGWVRRYGRDLLLIVAVFLMVRWWQAPDVGEGGLPPLEAATLDGRWPELASEDGPTLLHFWASWCGVCEMAAPNIVSVGRDSRVITVASRSGDDREVAKFVQAHGFEVPVVNDPSGLIAQRFGVRAFPTTFVLDEDGRVVVTEVGYTTTWGLKARLWWAGL